MKSNQRNCYLIVRSVICVLIIGISVNCLAVVQQGDSIDRMAYEAMQSLSQANLPSSVKTIAIGNLIQAPDDLYKDLTQHLFDTRKFKVINRRQLANLREEFKFIDTSGLINPNEMKELKLHGIDAFIFGRKLQTGLRNPTFVIKLVDVNTGAILWGNILGKQKDEALTETAAQVKRIEAASLRSSNPVRTVAFWRVENQSRDRNLDMNGLMDVMATELSQSGRFKVIDRQNLEALAKEQEFTQSGLVNPKDIKEFGTQYGINGFIFGTVTDGNSEAISVMLKLVEAETATIAWAETLETPISKQWYKEHGKSRKEIVDMVISKLREESTLRMSDVDTLSLDIQIKGERNTNAAKIADEIGAALLKHTRFKWIDRKNYLGVLVDEQIRSGSGFVGRSKLELKALGIDAFLYGELSQEDQTTWVLYLEAIKVDTAEIVSVIQAEGKLSYHELREGRSSVWVKNATNLRTRNSHDVFLQEASLASNQLSSLLNVSVDSKTSQILVKSPHFTSMPSRSSSMFSLVRVEGNYRTGRFETTPIQTQFVPVDSATRLQLQPPKNLKKGNYAIHENHSSRPSRLRENQSSRQGKYWFFRVDGGEALFPMKNATALALHPTRSNTVYAGTANGVYKTTDGGQTWQYFGLRNNNILILEIKDDNQLYAKINKKHVYSKTEYNTYSDPIVYKTNLSNAKWQNATYTETYKVDGNNRRRKRYVSASKPDDPGLEGLIERYLGSAPLAYTPFAGEAIYVSTKTGVYKSIDSGNSWKHSDEIGQPNRSVPRQLTGYTTQRRNLVNQISENEDYIRKHPTGTPLLAWGTLGGLAGGVAYVLLHCDERVPDPANPGETTCVGEISSEDMQTILTIIGAGVAAGLIHELIWAGQRSLKEREIDQFQQELHRLDQQARNDTPYRPLKSTLKNQLKKISLNYRPQFGGIGVQYSVLF